MFIYGRCIFKENKSFAIFSNLNQISWIRFIFIYNIDKISLITEVNLKFHLKKQYMRVSQKKTVYASFANKTQ